MLSDNKELQCHESEYSSSFQNIMASHLQRIASSLLILFSPGTFPFSLLPILSINLHSIHTRKNDFLSTDHHTEEIIYHHTSFPLLIQYLGYFPALVLFYFHLSCFWFIRAASFLQAYYWKSTQSFLQERGDLLLIWTVSICIFSGSLLNSSALSKKLGCLFQTNC